MQDSVYNRTSMSPSVLGARVLEPEVEQGDRMEQGPSGPRIRCPLCGWSPEKGSRWMCNYLDCGHLWNTFDTGGVCPKCLYQWKETACLACHRWSLHSDWYVID